MSRICELDNGKDGKWNTNLQNLLQSSKILISEEHAWSFIYQIVKHYRDFINSKKNFVFGQNEVLSKLEDVIIYRNGVIACCWSEACVHASGSSPRSNDVELSKASCGRGPPKRCFRHMEDSGDSNVDQSSKLDSYRKVLRSIAFVVYKALDFNIAHNMERQLDSDLHDILMRMCDFPEVNQLNDFYYFNNILEACVRRIQPANPNTYYQNFAENLFQQYELLRQVAAERHAAAERDKDLLGGRVVLKHKAHIAILSQCEARIVWWANFKHVLEELKANPRFRKCRESLDAEPQEKSPPSSSSSSLSSPSPSPSPSPSLLPLPLPLPLPPPLPSLLLSPLPSQLPSPSPSPAAGRPKCPAVRQLTAVKEVRKGDSKHCKYDVESERMCFYCRVAQFNSASGFVPNKKCELCEKKINVSLNLQ